MCTYLIIGGNGFIGSALVNQLSELPDTCKIYIVAENGPTIVGATDKVTTFGNPSDASLQALISMSDYIFHLGATVGVEKIMRDPCGAMMNSISITMRVISCNRRYRRPIIFTSSSEVYRNVEDSRESQPLYIERTDDIRTSYAISKLTCESMLSTSGQPVIITRLFNVVGRGQRPNSGMVIPKFVAAAINGEPLVVHDDGRQIRCFCHVSDATNALISLHKRKDLYGNIYNIGNPSNKISIRDLANKVIQLSSGTSSDIQYTDYSSRYDGEDIHIRIPNIDRIKNDINWNPKVGLDFIIEGVIDETREDTSSLSAC